MHKVFSTRKLCRAGVIAALYVALTYAFAPLAYGPFQIRPAEALCILAVIYPEAIPALCVGCACANIASPYFAYDIPLGTLATLLGALGSYFVGKYIRKKWLKVLLGGFFPVFFNAVIVPFTIVFLCGLTDGYASPATAYLAFLFSIAFTEAVWVYALGAPLYFTIDKMRKRGVRMVMD